MKGYIDKIDWLNIEPMKYWAFPASTSDQVKKETVRNAIFSNEYIGALKVDGYYQRLLKDEDGNCFMIARSRNVNGEIVNKIDWVPQLKDWMDTLPNGTCVLSEAYLPGNEGSKNVTSILGCLKEKAIERQKKTPLHFHVFDVMAYDGKNLNKTAFSERIKYLTILPCDKNDYVNTASYFEGEELWDNLQAYLAEGREGMVIMRKDAIVYNKRTPARVSIKVKKELKESIDCIIIGANAPTKQSSTTEIETWQYWENIVTNKKLEGVYYQEYMQGEAIEPVTKAYFYGWCGSLKLGLIDKNNNIIHIGDLSGLTDEMKEHWKDYVGKVVEVGAMEVTKNQNGGYGLRHPRMIAIRQDKNPRECILAQICEL